MQTRSYFFSTFFLGAVLGLGGPLAVRAAVLEGLVRDATGAVIPRAQVSAHSRDRRTRSSAFSNDEGRFRFADLQTGEYLIEASAAGHASSMSDPVDLKQDETREIDVVLGLPRVETRIIVTAEDSAQSESEVAKAVDVVSGADIETRSKLSLSDAIQSLPGVRVQNLGGPGSFTRIVSRGLRPQDTAITIDGMRFRDAATTQGDATPFLETLFMVNADRVEVLRGTGSSLYGSNAIGAVVNTVTDNGGGPLRGQVLIDGGGLGMARGLAKVAGGWRENKLTYSAGVQHLNVRNGVDGNDPFRNTTLQTAAQLRPTSTLSLSGRVWTGDSFTLLNDSPYSAPAGVLPPFGTIEAAPVSLDVQRSIEAGGNPALGSRNVVPNLNDPDSRRASRYSAAAFVLSHQLAANASHRLSYQHVGTRRNFSDGPAGSRFEPGFSTLDRIRGSIDTVQWRGTAQMARWNTLTGGYEFERERYRSEYEDFPVVASARQTYQTTADQSSHSVMLHNQTRLLSERLHISVSARMQRFALDSPTFSQGASRYLGIDFKSPKAAKTGDAAVAYFAPATRTKFRAHAGNGYRAPSIYERFGSSFFEGRFTPLGDPNVRPDRTFALDYGIDQYFGNDKLRVSATHFYTNLQEVISFDSTGALQPATDPFGRSSGYTNTGGGIARGVEVSAELTPVRKLRLLGSYTFTNADLRRSNTRDADFFKSPFVSDHQATATAFWTLTKRLDTAIDLWAVSNHPTILSRRPFLFPGARKVDVVVNYSHPVTDRTRLRFFGKLNNVLDSNYLENGFRTPGFWGTAGMSVLF